MSIWTHVVGNIRIDGIPRVNGNTVEDIEKALGPIATFDNDVEYEDTTLPCGSEGSLQYQIIEYDDGFCWVTVPIWGDLRSYDNNEAIREWWKDTLKKFRMIRDAVLKVEVEGREPMILTEKDVEK